MVLVMSRQRLANRLRQNWLSKYPTETGGQCAPYDDSLTSLNWLHNLNVLKLTTPQCPETTTVVEDTQCGPWTGPTELETDMFADPDLLGIDFATNPHVKPPYSYSTLICMAMRASKDSKITLSGIYNWITDNFMYYQVAEPSWQNSIRHNLSLNKCFQKVPRRKDEPGKGGFWMINPNYENVLVNGILRKRRSPSNTTSSAGYSREATSTNLQPAGQPPAKKTRHERTEESAENVLHIAANAGDNSANLDVSWSAILHQDIEVGGAKVKTEDIIDERDDKLAHNELASTLTHQVSDNNSDCDIADLLNANLDSPVDFLTGDPLDLTVLGASIRAPEWWSDQMQNNNFLDQSAIFQPDNKHPWAEDRTHTDFDLIDTDIHRLFDSSTLSQL